MSFFDRQGIPDVLLRNQNEQITSRQDQKGITDSDSSCVDNNIGYSDDEENSTS
jgi:hypothetical protein